MKNKIAYLGCLSLIGMITTEFGVIGILPPSPSVRGEVWLKDMPMAMEFEMEDLMK